jgi:ubiquinone biosynthesis protein COQ4
VKPSDGYAYSSQSTRNPFRFLLALWRSIRDPSRTDEVAIVEIGFARSRLGRRFSRWEELLARLDADPRTAAMARSQQRFGPLDLAALSRLPEGTLGRVFAEHCYARGIDPNLIHVPGEGAVERLLDRLFASHDLWHVTTGWGNDETGEVGLGGFYVAQLQAPFFVFLIALVFLNTVFVAPATLRTRMDAFVAGYRLGRSAEPLFAADWDLLFSTPLPELRRRLGLAGAEIVGEGIVAAA